MLTFVVSDGYEISWHHGEKTPELWQPMDSKSPRRYITDAYADGHELLYVTSKFGNIPYAIGKQPVHWTGETARFIFDNL